MAFASTWYCYCCCLHPGSRVAAGHFRMRAHPLPDLPNVKKQGFRLKKDHQTRSQTGVYLEYPYINSKSGERKLIQVLNPRSRNLPLQCNGVRL